jgi:hypothetical protein
MGYPGQQPISLHLRNLVEALDSPPRLPVGRNVRTTQGHLVPETPPNAGMALSVVDKLCKENRGSDWDFLAGYGTCPGVSRTEVP